MLQICGYKLEDCCASCIGYEVLYAADMIISKLHKKWSEGCKNILHQQAKTMRATAKLSTLSREIIPHSPSQGSHQKEQSDDDICINCSLCHQMQEQDGIVA